MGRRVMPASIFLPSSGDGPMNRAIMDMYRIIARRLDAEITSDVYANRPTSDGSNRLFFSTDTGVLYFDTAAGWVASAGSDDFNITGGNPLSIQQAQGAKAEIKTYREVLSVSVSPTDTSANLLPANALILDVSVRVTTAVSGTLVTFSVGDPTTAARFAAAVAKALNTTAVGILQWSGAVTTLAAGPSQAAAAKVRITATSGTIVGGVIEIIVHALEFTAPTS